MNSVFEKAGIEVTKQNKQDVDKAIHSIVGVAYKNCSSTWKEVKKRLAENEESFVQSLRKEVLG
ncbi:MAG: hypothetical protein NWF03_03965 [Candidatus Bathyarchaeota archaeon]|nr:hypothetical protein [Candidatus Bathyarchaeota archaeon]